MVPRTPKAQVCDLGMVFRGSQILSRVWSLWGVSDRLNQKLSGSRVLEAGPRIPAGVSGFGECSWVSTAFSGSGTRVQGFDVVTASIGPRPSKT